MTCLANDTNKNWLACIRLCFWPKGKKYKTHFSRPLVITQPPLLVLYTLVFIFVSHHVQESLYSKRGNTETTSHAQESILVQLKWKCILSNNVSIQEWVLINNAVFSQWTDLVKQSFRLIYLVFIVKHFAESWQYSWPLMLQVK